MLRAGRILGLVLLLQFSLSAEMLQLDHFKANVFSKTDKKPVEINLSLMIDGRDVKSEEHKVIDALNVVIGSYYAEDLVTSKGKELLKSTLIAYTRKVHSLDIDTIFIKELTVRMTPTTQEIIEALKKEGLFQQQSSAPKQQYQQLPPLDLSPPLPKRSLTPEDGVVNF